MGAKLAIALCASLIMALAGSVSATATVSQAAPSAPVLYTVKPGDSLSSIAKAYFHDV